MSCRDALMSCAVLFVLLTSCQQRPTDHEPSVAQIGPEDSLIAVEPPEDTHDGPDRDECAPTFRRSVEKPVEIQSGAWVFGVDVFLLGCAGELERLTDNEVKIVMQEVVSRVSEIGLPFFRDHQDVNRRADLLGSIHDQLDDGKMSDLLIVLRYSIEREVVEGEGLERSRMHFGLPEGGSFR